MLACHHRCRCLPTTLVAIPIALFVAVAITCPPPLLPLAVPSLLPLPLLACQPCPCYSPATLIAVAIALFDAVAVAWPQPLLPSPLPSLSQLPLPALHPYCHCSLLCLPTSLLSLLPLLPLIRSSTMSLTTLILCQIVLKYMF
jgi:hypothetical protein